MIQPRHVLATVLVLCFARPAHSQAVQAARGVARQGEERDAENRARAFAALKSQLVTLEVAFSTVSASRSLLTPKTAAESSTVAAQDLAAARLTVAASRARAALEASGDPRLFRELLNDYNAYIRETNQATGRASPFATSQFGITAAASQVSTLVPDVAFTIGPELSFGGQTVGTFGISTNLLGAAAGTAFDALGADKLKQYFQDNVAVATVLPTNGVKKITAQIGLGLGGLAFGSQVIRVNETTTKTVPRITVWPALQIDQHDTSDARVPSDLKTRFSDQKSWASPSIAIALVPWSEEEIEQRVKARKFVVIPTIGVRLPYFFPGESFDALAALFSKRRTDFERGGKTQVTIGLAVPFPKVSPPSPPPSE